MKVDFVYYDNILEDCNFSNLTHYELNLLFGIFGRLHIHNELFLRADEVREYCSSPARKVSYKQAEEIANSLCKKLDKLFRTNAFDVFQVDYADSENKKFDGMYIKLWDSHEFLFQNLDYKYTTLDYNEFKKYASTYTKHIFRLLSQFSYSCVANINYFEFCRILGIKKTTRYCDVNHNIISPAIKSLKHYFNNLSFKVTNEVEEGVKRKGRIIFYFKKINNKDFNAKELAKLKAIHNKMTKDIGERVKEYNFFSNDEIKYLVQIETRIKELQNS